MAETSTKTRACGDCHRDFEGTARAKRCDSCKVEYRRVVGRERMQAWRASQCKPELQDPTCQDCGIAFKNPKDDGRQTKKYCDSCLADRMKENSRRAYEKRRAVNPPVKMVRTCLDCPADITGTHARTVRCESCQDVHRRERMREYVREWRQAQPKPVFRCKTCDVVLDRHGKSGIGHYCDDCRPAATRETQKRAEANARMRRGTTWATHCFYCGVEFDKPRQRAKVPNRCEECKKDRHRAYIKVYYAKQPRGLDHARRARKMGLGYERFKVVDIYERDRWRCGICRTRISRKLRYPHPMSVSLDHKIPLAKGGHHSRSNAQAAHLRCNLRKRTHVAPLGEQIPLPI